MEGVWDGVFRLVRGSDVRERQRLKHTLDNLLTKASMFSRLRSAGTFIDGAKGVPSSSETNWTTTLGTAGFGSLSGSGTP